MSPSEDRDPTKTDKRQMLTNRHFLRRLLAAAVLVLSGLETLSGADWDTFGGLVESLQLNRDTADWSQLQRIVIGEPRMAYVNLTGFSRMPTSKTSYMNGWAEIYDGEGHYLRKRVRIHGQGGYSIRYPKKNFSLKFCEEDYSEAVTTDVKIGEWVVQDGFHFKAFWTDFSRGLGEMGYKMFALIVADRRPYWERGGYEAESAARCFPDGFPCAVYLEGRFYGVFAWQLKKHRKNMNMKRSAPEHIHLDGNVSDTYLFRGKVSWNQFEVRNPKDLYTQQGSYYDGNSPAELMGTDSEHYYGERDDEATRQEKQRSALVKESILRLSHCHAELQALEASGASAAQMRSAFAERFDIESLLDYAVFYYLSANGDGTLKNWQWFTYDGRRWMVAPYDLDQTFGINLYAVVRPPTFDVSELTNGPFYWLDRYFGQDIRHRWAQLRSSGVISGERLVPIVTDWCRRVGNTFYAMEQTAWPLSPCYCETVCNAPWQIYEQWEDYPQAPAYAASTTYARGDFVKLEGRLWQTTEAVKGVYPFSRNANIDTQERLEGWIPARIAHLDQKFGYDGGTAVGRVGDEASGQVVAVYTLNGLRIRRPAPGGIYLYKYRNGTFRKVMVR